MDIEAQNRILLASALESRYLGLQFQIRLRGPLRLLSLVGLRM